MSHVNIDLSEVESTVSALVSGVAASEVVSMYSDMLSGFSDSRGLQAGAMRRLLIAERNLTRNTNQLLTQFANSIQFAVNEMTGVDRRYKEQMNVEQLNL